MSRLAPAGTVVRLAYGRAGLDLRLPVPATVIRPRHAPPLEDPVAALAEAVRQPLHGPPLRDLVPRGSRVGVSVCDVTRPFPGRVVLPMLLDEIAGASVTLFVATGTHRSCTPGELSEMFGASTLARVGVVQHDAFESRDHREVCVVPGSDRPALLDRRFLDQDLRITLGFIEPHFFAGFSGGPKMVAPGLASIETVLELHSSARIGNRRATFGILDGNPVHDAIEHVASAADVAFALDVTLDAENRITGVWAGSPWVGHCEGCRVVRETAMVPVEEAFDIVVTTNSGYPLDQNLYQTVKGICAAAEILKPGGAILVASECSDGLPDHGQYRSLLAAHAGPSAYLDALREGRVRTHDQWQVQKQAVVLERARVLVHASGLDEAAIRAAWFEPAGDPEQALRDLAASGGQACRIAVLPEGPQTIAYLA
jgi:nickel-dependent lactate racemase